MKKRVACKFTVLTLILSLLLISNVYASASNFNLEKYPSTPEGVVYSYCKMDADGAGLETESWLELQKLTLWEDAPGWDMSVVIKKFNIKKISESQDRAEVKVEYDLVGILKQNGRFHLDTEKISETFIFKLIKKENVWKIESPQEPPHISIDTAIKRLEAESPERMEKGLIKYLKMQSVN